jgi:hypothetical protein
MRAREFDCAECGRHITSVGYTPPEAPHLCAACLVFPGWFYDKQLKRALDPDGEVIPRRRDA